MNTLKPTEINKMLAVKCETLASYLLPDGKRQGREWCIGSVDGEQGQSCQINLDGKGFIDRATGEHGDYLQLWMETRKINLPDAITECKAWLGISEPERKVKKSYRRPEKPKSLSSLKGPVVQYLMGRGLSQQTIKKYKVAQIDINGKPAIAFPFLRNGELIQVKRLGVDRPNGKKEIRVEPDCEPCLFGWQAISENSRILILTEGEIDAMSLCEYGFPAMSVPFGGGDGAKQDWIEYEYPHLARFEEIFICMDTDDAGQIAASAIANRLGLDRCKVVKLPLKDANQCLTEKVTEEQILTAFANAKYLSHEELVSPADFKDSTLDFMFSDEVTRGIQTPWSRVNDVKTLWYGELTLINGINGHGKSELANQIMIHAAFNGVPGFVASPEFITEILNTRLIKQAGATQKPSREFASKVLDELDEKIWLTNIKGGINPNKILDLMWYAFKRYGIRLYLIDSLMKCGIDDNDYNGQKEFVSRLCEFKNETNTHVILVTHSKKAESEDKPSGKMDVKGSGTITDLADNLYIIWRNKKREKAADLRDLGEALTMQESDLLEKPGCYLKQEKNRNGGKEKTFALYFNQHSNQFLESEHYKPKTYVKTSLEEVA